MNIVITKATEPDDVVSKPCFLTAVTPAGALVPGTCRLFCFLHYWFYSRLDHRKIPGRYFHFQGGWSHPKDGCFIITSVSFKPISTFFISTSVPFIFASVGKKFPSVPFIFASVGKKFPSVPFILTSVATYAASVGIYFNKSNKLAIRENEISISVGFLRIFKLQAAIEDE